MKKSKIAAGVVVALAAVWCAGAWFNREKSGRRIFTSTQTVKSTICQNRCIRRK